MIITFYYIVVPLLQVLLLADTFVTGFAVVAVFVVVESTVCAVIHLRSPSLLLRSEYRQRRLIR